MTIEQRGVVDFIGISKNDGATILTISDHLEWTDYDYHSMSLQNKINDYLEYIYTDPGFKKHNESIEGIIRIQLIMKHEPSTEGTELLNRIGAAIRGLGFQFFHGVFREG